MEIKIKDHKYTYGLGSFARPAPLLTGSILGEEPQYFKSTFECECGRTLYDGGMCQAVLCICGLWQKRFEDSFIIKFKQEPKHDKCTSKGFAEQVNLLSATFAVFTETIRDQYKISDSIDYSRLVTGVLKPFFTLKLRCIEEGMTFSYKEIKFKVLSCYPRQGFVIKSTRIHLYKTVC